MKVINEIHQDMLYFIRENTPLIIRINDTKIFGLILDKVSCIRETKIPEIDYEKYI